MIELDTQEQITDAGGRIAGMRLDLDAGRALTLDEQRLAAEIAAAALYRLTPRPEERWTDGDAWEMPAWLRQLQGSEGAS